MSVVSLQGKALEVEKCSRGHNKLEVGVNARRWCKQCARDYQRRWYRKNAGEANARKSRYRRNKVRSNPASHVYKSSVPNLRAVREDFNLTQKQFARMCGLSKSMISEIERSVKKASPDTQSKILDTIVRLKQERRELRQRMRRAGL